MATREITQLPDRFTGDINNIRDKKIAEASDATAASDITSQCEYLIKNGQTGEFMNVLKSYIDESIRSALGALVSNLDKGTSISKLLATDSSNDLGTITPANLASVLSVNKGATIGHEGIQSSVSVRSIRQALKQHGFGGYLFSGAGASPFGSSSSGYWYYFSMPCHPNISDTHIGMAISVDMSKIAFAEISTTDASLDSAITWKYYTSTT